MREERAFYPVHWQHQTSLGDNRRRAGRSRSFSSWFSFAFSFYGCRSIQQGAGIRSEMPTLSDLHSACKGSGQGRPRLVSILPLHLHPPFRLFLSCRRAAMSVNEEGSTSCMLMSYHSWQRGGLEGRESR